MADPGFIILEETAELLVVNKPAGLVCHPSKTGPMSSLIGRVRLYLGEGSTPHLINRLDRETSGVTLVAKDVDTAVEIRRAWELRLARKEYLAITHGHWKNDDERIDAPLGKDINSEIAIKDCVRPDGAPALTEASVVKRFDRDGRPFTLVQAAPHTGRKHQIRIHLASLGHPIVGDKIYSGDDDLYLAFVQWRQTEEQRKRLILANHALHAQRVEFPWRGDTWSFSAPPEKAFADFAGL